MNNKISIRILLSLFPFISYSADAITPSANASSISIVADVEGVKGIPDEYGTERGMTKINFSIGDKNYGCSTYMMSTSIIPSGEKLEKLRGTLSSVDYFHGGFAYWLRRTSGKIEIFTDQTTQTNVLTIKVDRLGNYNYEVLANCSDKPTFIGTKASISSLNFGSKIYTTYTFKEPNKQKTVTCLASGSRSDMPFMTIDPLEGATANADEALYSNIGPGMSVKQSKGFLQISNPSGYAIMTAYASQLLRFPDFNYYVSCQVQ